MTFETKVIACWPSDRKLMDQLDAELPPGAEPFRPSIEHSLTKCDLCGRSVWIGPNQKQLHESVFMRSVVHCLICIKGQSLNGGEIDIEPTIFLVNTEIDSVHKRY